MKYDYIFAGLGLSSLMVLNEMWLAGLLIEKNILLLEPDQKNKNDRTWCFWQEAEADWNSIIKKQWDRALFLDNKTSIDCISGNMRYKMIESLCFYQLIIDRLKMFPKIVFKQESMISFSETTLSVKVKTAKETYYSDYFFNSIFDVKTIQNNKKFPLLQQHFVGWFIKTKSPVFDANLATFMDFSVLQNQNTRFMYVLPLSANEALVEYTLFSKNLLKENEYELAIVQYLELKGITDFKIIKTEKGNIPMTAYPFWKENTKRILRIGTSGGWTKPSTGYTFINTTKQAKNVVLFLEKNKIDFSKFHKTNRFYFYDRLFVWVLYKNNELGRKLFSNIFTKVKPEIVFRFLDEKSSFADDLKIIFACPKIPFIKALFSK